MVREALLEHLPSERRPALVRVETELGAADAAAAYEERLRAMLGNHPRLDLALLGLGPDAHTASLFPGMPALQEHHRLAVEVPEAGMAPRVARVTLTFPVLNAAREVVFLVSGEDKAEAVRRAFGDPPDPAAPAAHVRPGAGTLTVIVDEAAAAQLEP
jgi:6-phosphogluconolactonase